MMQSSNASVVADSISATGAIDREFLSPPVNVDASRSPLSFLERSLNALATVSATTTNTAAATTTTPGPSTEAVLPSRPTVPSFVLPPTIPSPLSAFPCDDDEPSLNMVDLALLHHYTTVTAPMLNPWCKDLRHWWEHEVPRVAFYHHYVMRSLLALAGLHVAYLSCPSNIDPSLPNCPVTGTNAPPGTTDTSNEDVSANRRAFHISRAIEQHKIAGQEAAALLPNLDQTNTTPCE